MRARLVMLTLVSGWSASSLAQAPCAPIAIEGCANELDEAALRRALQTEGVTCGVRALCEGAMMRVGEGGPSYALETIPGPVRARVVALLIAEWMREPGEGRGLPGTTATDTGPSAVSGTGTDTGADSGTGTGTSADTGTGTGTSAAAGTSTGTSADTGTGAGAGTGTSAAPGTVTARGTGTSAGPGGELEPASAPGLATSLDAPVLARRAHPAAAFVHDETSLDPDVSPRIGVGGDLWLFFDPLTALAGPSAVLAVDAFRLELGWAFGTADDPDLGSVDISLGHVSAGVNIACARFTDASVCGSAFATLGYARADPQAAVDGPVLATTHDGVYGGGALELGVWLATEDVAIALGVRGGWGYGLVVMAATREIAAIGGGWIGAKLAVELGPFR